MMVRFRRIWMQLTADRKRFGVLCGAFAVALLLWARLIVVSNVPRTAVADDVNESTDAPDRLASVHGLAVEKGEKNRILIALQSRPERDPFVISNKHFPKPSIVEVSEKEADKSPPNAVEDAGAREARITAQLQEIVDGFSLEAVMSGPPPMALINGKTYRIGEIVGGGESGRMFTLVEVGRRQVVLESHERRFNLMMRVPGDR